MAERQQTVCLEGDESNQTQYTDKILPNYTDSEMDCIPQGLSGETEVSTHACDKESDSHVGEGSSGEADEPTFSIFTEKEKIIMVLTVSFVALLSPLSGAIYLPALPAISKELNISHSLVNLTITTYMV